MVGGHLPARCGSARHRASRFGGVLSFLSGWRACRLDACSRFRYSCLVSNHPPARLKVSVSARRVTKMPTLREQLMKIAKRGRKRYLGLTFVTQSPNDLPDDVLGLVNNWVVYKIDEATIRRLKSYIPNSDESLWSLVRGLGPGQALVSFA